ncbi:MAG: cytochrome b N-terminal domain-containing protein [Acidobacteriota bacterium]|nr:cytochrome b N-terminal domain-containing protein [Blastocatellia bacterium]MDW8411506.1 cytochrome b N-terminal domain-containing protein [Acidobacteriota bacterium]
MMQKILDWLDERIALRQLWAAYADRNIPGGASWSYVFSSGLKSIYLTQFLTGLLLLLYYVPSTDHAHTTVEYIQKEVYLGYLVRGLHFYGANLLLILSLLHLGQTLLTSAYKNKRELVWISGLILLVLLQGAFFTGYLLPWDQKAYFGTQVALSILSSVPLVGELLETIVKGGPRMSTLTLSRFFVLHVLLLPALFITMLTVHILLSRRASLVADKQTDKVDKYYPSQFVRNTVFAFLLLLLLATLSHLVPVTLEPKADPSDTTYIPRPEWYFLPLFQLLKYFPGQLAIVPALLLPGLLFTVLALLPFLDRKVERRSRLGSAFLIVFICGFSMLLTLAKLDDYKDVATSKQLLAQQEKARVFLSEPFLPQRLDLKTQQTCPPASFLINCAECHGQNAEGTKNGPKLIGITHKPARSPKDLPKLLRDPSSYGLSEDMPDFSSLPDEEIEQIVDYLSSL